LSESELISILNTLQNELELNAGKKRTVSMIESVSSKLRVNNWDGLIKERVILNALQTVPGEAVPYYGKPLDSAELSDALYRLAHHAAAACIRLLQEQTRSVHTLIDSFAKNYEDEKIAANGLQFDDVTQYVAEFIQYGDLHQIFWRMNSPIEHLLLDEFQDTSLDQWKIFRPIGDYCTEGKGRSFFCVGDVKQAIYRWRNGRAEIFDAIENTFPGIEQESSNTSWRSAPPILDCVNRFFLDPEKNPEIPPAEFCAPVQSDLGPEAKMVPVRELMSDLAREAWDGWKFQKHVASPKSGKYPGYWELCTMPEKGGADDVLDDEKDSDEPADAFQPSPEDVQLRWVAQRIAEIYRQGKGLHRIGVLFRKNREIPKVARFLRELGVAVSEEGKNPLTNSNSVCLTLSLLNLMDFPDDSLAWFHVGNSILSRLFPALKWEDEKQMNPEERQMSRLERTRCLASLRERLQAFGIAQFLEEIAQFLMEYCTEEEARRLKQLLNLAAAYSQVSQLERISDFVSYIQNFNLEDPSAASIILMSIHRSKGLQFDVVVLPDLKFAIAGTPPQFVPGYENDDVLKDVTLVTPVPSQDIREALFPLDSPIRQATDLNTRERISEAWSLLYVAMTRAIYAMYLFIPPRQKDQKVPFAQVSDLLRTALSGAYSAKEKTRLAYGGDPKWYEKTPQAVKFAQKQTEENARSAVETPAEAAKSQTPEPIRFLPNPDSTRDLTRRAPSNIEDRRFVDLSRKLEFSQQNTVNGTILHGWYEKIAWMENSLPSDDELVAFARPFGLNKDRLERLLKSFHNSLKSPRVDRALHWTTYIPMLREKVLRAGILPPELVPMDVFRRFPNDPNEIRWEVYREKELAIRTETELLLGTLDRLILLRNDAQVFWADCVDYKTTRKISSPEILEEKIRSHSLQMRDYRRMLQLHYQIDDTQISTHLIFSMLGIVREVLGRNE
ncbi:MAG: UvrD-helicase domain-containing protein, partial [Thermoguttaceae bacterium]|nr:UvrD-helicase domain-containing protein [Thermoguttaceae bacterium]